MPTADDFAALARSSPWLWSTLRFTLHHRNASGDQPPIRARLRRPDLLRVEDEDGELQQIVKEPRRVVGIVTFGPDGGSVSRELPWASDPDAPSPRARADGLVIERPGGWSTRFSFDAPMYQSYYWVALLDPVELADGNDHQTGDARPGTTISEVREVDHHGRAAWEAVVAPTKHYEPRCGCCSLLRSAAIDRAEWDKLLLEHYPEAHRIRLDRETGVCVFACGIGGDPVGGHDVRIEAVDEPMDDALFIEDRPPDQGRRFGWSPVPGTVP